MSTGGRSSSDVSRNDVSTDDRGRHDTERGDSTLRGGGPRTHGRASEAADRGVASRGSVRTSVHGGPRLLDRARDEEAEGGIAAEEHILHRLREREREQARSRAGAGGAGQDLDPGRGRTDGPGPDGTDDDGTDGDGTDGDGHLRDGGVS